MNGTAPTPRSTPSKSSSCITGRYCSSSSSTSTPTSRKKRFKQRLKIPYKRHKLTDEDLRNRERWHDYESAVHDMVEQTSTGTAPWVLVEGNDKRHARIKILETICERLEEKIS